MHVYIPLLYLSHSSLCNLDAAALHPGRVYLSDRACPNPDTAFVLRSTLSLCIPRSIHDRDCSSYTMTALEETTQQDESAKLHELLLVSVTILEQGVDLVENVLKQDEHLTTHSQYLPGSTIGES